MKEKNLFQEMEKKYRHLEYCIEAEESFFIEEVEAVFMSEFFNQFDMPERSLKILKHAFTLHPKSLFLKSYLALAYIVLDKAHEAEKILAELNAIVPDDPIVLLCKGACLSKVNFDEAEEVFDQVINTVSVEERPRTAYRVAWILDETGRSDKAIKYYKQVMELDPENLFAEMYHASCYERIGNPERAIELYNHLLDKEPYLAMAWLYLGNIHRRQEQFDKAIDSYDYALAIDPSLLAAIFHKAGIYIRQNHLHEAIELLNVINVDTIHRETRIEILTRLLDCHSKLEDNEKMLEIGGQMVWLYPSSIDGWAAISMAQLNMLKFDQAIQPLKRLLQLVPDSLEHLEYLGFACSKQGMTDEALQAYLRAYDLGSREPHVIISIINLYTRSGEYAEALKYALEQFQAQPDLEDLPYVIGNLYYLLGQFEQLEAHLLLLMERGNVDAPLLFLEEYPDARHQLRDFVRRFYPDYEPDE